MRHPAALCSCKAGGTVSLQGPRACQWEAERKPSTKTSLADRRMVTAIKLPRDSLLHK